MGLGTNIARFTIIEWCLIGASSVVSLFKENHQAQKQR